MLVRAQKWSQNCNLQMEFDWFERSTKWMRRVSGLFVRRRVIANQLRGSVRVPVRQSLCVATAFATHKRHTVAALQTRLQRTGGKVAASRSCLRRTGGKVAASRTHLRRKNAASQQRLQRKNAALQQRLQRKNAASQQRLERRPCVATTVGTQTLQAKVES